MEGYDLSQVGRSMLKQCLAWTTKSDISQYITVDLFPFAVTDVLKKESNFL